VRVGVVMTIAGCRRVPSIKHNAGSAPIAQSLYNP
jgi:hypothetical protein